MIRFEARHQKPPTFRDIMAEFGIESPNGVTANLKALAKKGLVRKAGENYVATRDSDYWRQWWKFLPKDQRDLAIVESIQCPAS